MAPKRPSKLPAGASYDAAGDRWSVGESSDGKRTGRWSWYDKRGELAEIETYRDGNLHGAVAWIKTKADPRPLWKALPKPVCRMDMAYVDGAARKRYFTLYNADGRSAPVPAAPDGRSIGLGDHLGKLLQQTVLLLVEPEFEDQNGEMVHAGTLTGDPSAARGRYLFAVEEMPGIAAIQFHYDDPGEPAESFWIDAEELSRAFTLAADYYLTALATKRVS